MSEEYRVRVDRTRGISPDRPGKPAKRLSDAEIIAKELHRLTVEVQRLNDLYRSCFLCLHSDCTKEIDKETEIISRKVHCNKHSDGNAKDCLDYLIDFGIKITSLEQENESLKGREINLIQKAGELRAQNNDLKDQLHTLRGM